MKRFPKDDNPHLDAKRRRRVARGGMNRTPRSSDEERVRFKILDVEKKPRGKSRGNCMVTVGLVTSGMGNPATAVGKTISDALDPTRASGKVTRLADMTPERRAEMQRLYGKPER